MDQEICVQTEKDTERYFWEQNEIHHIIFKVGSRPMQNLGMSDPRNVRPKETQSWFCTWLLLMFIYKLSKQNIFV